MTMFGGEWIKLTRRTNNVINDVGKKAVAKFPRKAYMDDNDIGRAYAWWRYVYYGTAHDSITLDIFCLLIENTRLHKRKGSMSAITHC